MKTVKLVLITAILWVGFATTSGTFGLPHFGPDSAFAGKNGNGNSGGSGSGRSNDNRGKSSSAKADKQKNRDLSAELKGLNSLNRNINGLVNSSDPKMDGFRDLVVDDAEPTEEELLAAIEAALGEEPESGWTDDLVSWVGERITELRTAWNEMPDTQPESQNPDNQ
jgi:hypothetical protein